ncbi:tetratricopeptide repeat protein [Pyxidicoccus fallax]|uniref:Tetratricopeptide repeat protein n=1 Tax=Pyxidicoccus fallax TaxID=394095 RepID=A0A848LGY2_9BACT|nr:tetratricopeptide repeat protein [Pyxidicoccus fallax]NMO16101.1 tetratricopeptide repeat protein [Pyxidicoccus fallax]NPC83255.1 tetratricopeptide repeat protein [Pyxidicoccus fallax]
MSLRACLLVLAAMSVACTHAPAPVAEPAPRSEPRYVVGLLPLRAATPEAAEVAKAQQARILASLHGLTREAPLDVVHPAVASPSTLEEARARTGEAKVNALAWGEVSLEGGKLAVKLSSFEATVGAPSGFWPMEYTVADAKLGELLELDALRIGQALMQESLLPMMMRYQPSNVRAMLEALVSKHPLDWVGLNPDIIERRWGMLGRLTRDGALAEKGYRAALAHVAAWRAKGTAAPGTDVKEAFYSVGLARGLLLQGRTREAVEVLAPIVKRMPGDVESRLILARAHLAQGDMDASAGLLRPLVDEGKNTAATRMYVTAVAAMRDGAELAKQALSVLVEKNPDDVMAWLLDSLSGPREALVAKLKSFIASHVSADWPLPVARYLVGELDEQALWAATKDEDSHTERLRRIQAHYYLGEAALAGQLPGHEGRADTREAQRHFEAAIGTHAFHHPTYDLADFQLEQLRRGLMADGR